MLVCCAVRRASAAPRGAAGARRRLLRRGAPHRVRAASIRRDERRRPRSSERRAGDRRGSGRRAPTADESWFGAFESGRGHPAESGHGPRRDSEAPAHRRGLDGRRRRRHGSRASCRARPTRIDQLGPDRVRAPLPHLHRRARRARRGAGGRARRGRLFGMRPTLPAALVSVDLRGTGDRHVAAAAFGRSPSRRRWPGLRSPQWLATIGVDLVCFSCCTCWRRARA